MTGLTGSNTQSNKNEETGSSVEKLLADHPEWDEAARQLIVKLHSDVQALTAENKRLRKAVLAERAKGPKMSTKLRDALYE
ncbi:hypothetical protein [Paenibacillus physcomitrellae]|uniref:Uncharacterized protein n=1 Tax=Paenibacillus physcomitrellae TaxID=1619311 RepID=A0ABQ1FNL1_9BACL|nr:hypothetical protein [Paenibacillus physcomitrellae]GGA22547.1 hypothetical protein GCM10010917_04120 [Paenibacillus physcomitrellae]